MKKIFAFLLVFALAVPFASAWDVDGDISGATKYKIDLGLKNQIRDAYDNAIEIELILPVSDVFKLGIAVDLDNDADKLDFTQSSMTHETDWDKIDTEIRIGLGIKPNENIEIGVDLYGGADYSAGSTDTSADYEGAFFREWDRDAKTVKEYLYGNSYFGLEFALGIGGLPLDKLWIIQKVKVQMGDGFKDGILKVSSAVDTTNGVFSRDQFKWLGVEYEGEVSTGVPFHTLMNLDISKLDLSLTYGYEINMRSYYAGYINGAHPARYDSHATSDPASWYNWFTETDNQAYTEGRRGFTSLPSYFNTNHDFKAKLKINYSNIETSVWIKPAIDYSLTSWKWNGLKPYQKDEVKAELYVGADWKISIPAQTFFPCVVSFKLGAEWVIVNEWKMYSDYQSDWKSSATGGFIDNTIYQAVRGTFEMAFDFNGVKATVGWSPDVYFTGGDDDTYYEGGSGGVLNAGGEGTSHSSNSEPGVATYVSDTNIFNLGTWKIGVSIQFDPIKKKTTAVEDFDEPTTTTDEDVEIAPTTEPVQ